MMRKLQNNVPMLGIVSAAALAMVGVVGRARVGDVALEQERITQIGGVLAKQRGRLGDCRDWS